MATWLAAASACLFWFVCENLCGQTQTLFKRPKPLPIESIPSNSIIFHDPIPSTIPILVFPRIHKREWPPTRSLSDPNRPSIRWSRQILDKWSIDCFDHSVTNESCRQREPHWEWYPEPRSNIHEHIVKMEILALPRRCQEYDR